MVIVDSSVWIDALIGKMTPQSIWLSQAFGKEEIGVTSLILCEVLQGVRTSAQFEGFLRDLVEFPVLETGSTKLAIASAGNYRLLRSRGITVRSTIDCIIATFCIEEGHQLIHNDRDFDAFEEYLGLNVFHPPATQLN
jgi:predicted nucleic acid-binding protein